MKPEALKNLATEEQDEEFGTLASGFADGGPFSCSNCVHMEHVKHKIVCKHPVVNANPQLKDKERAGDFLVVGYDDCCRFVRPESAEI